MSTTSSCTSISSLDNLFVVDAVNNIPDILPTEQYIATPTSLPVPNTPPPLASTCPLTTSSSPPSASLVDGPSVASPPSSSRCSGLALRRYFLFHNHHHLLPSSSSPPSPSPPSSSPTGSSIPLIPFSRWWTSTSKETAPATTSARRAALTSSPSSASPPPTIRQSRSFRPTSSSSPITSSTPPRASSTSRHHLTQRCVCCCSAGQLCEAADGCACCSARVLRFAYLSRRGYIPTIAERGESELSSVSTANELSVVSALGGWAEVRNGGVVEDGGRSEEEEARIVALLNDESKQSPLMNMILGDTPTNDAEVADSQVPTSEEGMSADSTSKLWFTGDIPYNSSADTNGLRPSHTPPLPYRPVNTLGGGCSPIPSANAEGCNNSELRVSGDSAAASYSPPSPSSSTDRTLSPRGPTPQSPTASTPNNQSPDPSVRSTPPLPLSPISSDVSSEHTCAEAGGAATSSGGSISSSHHTDVAVNREIHDLIFQGPPRSPCRSMFRVAEGSKLVTTEEEGLDKAGLGEDKRSVVEWGEVHEECRTSEKATSDPRFYPSPTNPLTPTVVASTMLTQKNSLPSQIFLENIRTAGSSPQTVRSPAVKPPTLQSLPPSFAPSSHRSRRRKTAPARPSPLSGQTSAARGKQLLEEVRRARSASISAAVKKGGSRQDSRSDEAKISGVACGGSLTTRSWGEEWDGLFWDSFCVYYARHHHTAQQICDWRRRRPWAAVAAGA
eukprot:GHVS01049475.1.p1 GENE.GHVS01049475.1~~GHVS01049475.1.p1  ORF type:complete len:729 (+),score=191.54 GHVS01049475.1:204-2390(+)